MLQVRLFGGVQARLDGRPVEAPARRRAWTLLAWLALHPGLHARGELAARFWPDVLDASARASLRSALWALRRALGEAGAAGHLVTTGDRVGLAPSPALWVDALAFGEHLAAGRLEDAVALCTGPLLAGVDEDWALRAADEHRDRLLDALERMAAAADSRGDGAEAVRLSRRQTALDPFGEEAHRRLMRRLAAAGDRSTALEVYARLVDRLRRELRLAPSAITRSLAADLRGPEGPAPAPAAAGPVAPAGAAPVPAAVVRALPLVGRHVELARLGEAWRSARAGRVAVAVVRGEPGIGKTRLAAELVARARAEGARIASCAALDLGGTAPFGLWAELIPDLAEGLRPPAGTGWAADVARLAPELEGRAGWGVPSRPAVPPELERARLFESVVALADRAARDGPLLILMEDLHGADAASLELAGYLVRRLRTARLLMLMTLRDRPVRAEAEGLLTALRARDALAADIALGPLSPEAAGRLVRSVANLDADDVVRAIDASEGNALLAVEAARAIAAGHGSPAARLRGVVASTARGLGGPARRLIEFAAAAGRGLEAWEVDALPLDDPVQAAAEAVERGALVADGGRLGHRHALLRDAVYDEVPEPRRAWLHAELAAMLGARPAPGTARRAAEIAHHLLLARRDDLAVVHLSRASAEARSVGAAAEAVGFMREAVALRPHDARLLLDLAEAHAWCGGHAAVDDALARAAALLRDDPSGSALLDLHLRAGAWFRGPLCDPSASLAHYREAIALLGRGAPARDGARAEALVGAAWCEAVAGDLGAAGRLLERVDALVAAGADDEVVSDSLSARGHALLRQGRFVEAGEPLIVAGRTALAAGRPGRAYDCWSNAATALACAGLFERALAIADQTIAAMRESGLATLELQMLAGRAHILARMGHADASSSAAEERGLAARLDDPALRALADYDAGLVALAAGDAAAAEGLLAAALAGDPVARISRPRARLARSEALIRLRRLDEAEAELDATALEPLRASDLPDTLVGRLTRLEGLIAAARGDIGLAVRRLEESASLWRQRADADVGGQYAASIVDLGRAPVAGLVEPAVELGRVVAELESLRAASIGR